VTEPAIRVVSAAPRQAMIATIDQVG
jgi:hypothetical protein